METEAAAVIMYIIQHNYRPLGSGLIVHVGSSTSQLGYVLSRVCALHDQRRAQA